VLVCIKRGIFAENKIPGASPAATGAVYQCRETDSEVTQNSTKLPNGRPPLSCYIRTLNEERIIARTIDAALTVADEVVIVDSGSTDRTVALAEAAGARVIRQPWLGLGGQKRVGEDACRHDWLLDLDADEVLTPELAAQIRAQFKTGEPQRKIYGLKLVNAPSVGEPWHNFSFSYRNKLYDRRVIRIPDHKAWDQLQIPPGMSPGRLEGALLHFAARDFAHIIEKQNRASTMMARDGGKKPIAYVALRVLFAMPVYFFKYFVLRGLWRAGIYGFATARIAAYGRWMRDAKLYEDHFLNKDGDGQK
jgi:glycosyltransferase involved in cell wall biosynthesis